KHAGEALPAPQAHEVFDPGGARDFRRAVRRAVVDDQYFNLVDASDRARYVGEHARQIVGFVQTGNLHDELHAPGLPYISSSAIDQSKRELSPSFTSDNARTPRTFTHRSTSPAAFSSGTPSCQRIPSIRVGSSWRFQCSPSTEVSNERRRARSVVRCPI